jgi:hypothetical protein
VFLSIIALGVKQTFMGLECKPDIVKGSLQKKKGNSFVFLPKLFPIFSRIFFIALK